MVPTAHANTCARSTQNRGYSFSVTVFRCMCAALTHADGVIQQRVALARLPQAHPPPSCGERESGVGWQI